MTIRHLSLALILSSYACGGDGVDSSGTAPNGYDCEKWMSHDRASYLQSVTEAVEADPFVQWHQEFWALYGEPLKASQSVTNVGTYSWIGAAWKLADPSPSNRQQFQLGDGIKLVLYRDMRSYFGDEEMGGYKLESRIEVRGAEYDVAMDLTASYNPMDAGNDVRYWMDLRIGDWFARTESFGESFEVLTPRQHVFATLAHDSFEVADVSTSQGDLTVSYAKTMRWSSSVISQPVSSETQVIVFNGKLLLSCDTAPTLVGLIATPFYDVSHLPDWWGVAAKWQFDDTRWRP